MSVHYGCFLLVIILLPVISSQLWGLLKAKKNPKNESLSGAYLIGKAMKTFRKAQQRRLGLKPAGFFRGSEYLQDHIWSGYGCEIAGDERDFRLVNSVGP